jgi:predicted nicotinamide N-methyase
MVSEVPPMVDYIPPSFGQPGVSVSYRPKWLCSSPVFQVARCPTIAVSVPPASIRHIFAHRQWRAGMLMSDAIVSGAFAIDSRAVLELGAGTGMPSITAAHVGAAQIVVVSDYDEPALIQELNANVRNNLPSHPDRAKRIKVVGHIWGKDTEELLDALPRGCTRYDVILLADCMWDPLSHADLLKTLLAVLAKTPEARVYVIAGLHTGRDKITSFIRRAFRAGLVLAPLASEPLWPQLSVAAAAVSDPNATKVGNEPLANAAEHILELEVCGNTPSQYQETADSTQTQPDELDEPRLTGNRRRFIIDGYGEQDEGDVKMRNRWLTVWSLAWAQYASTT